ncbi:HXXEE domain-containing protein [Streptococcus gallolyticus subsp. gallolyticus]|uniref:HXXEE domain-containing protein n=1 Tax=Streptococcus gallolyticus TaxID=315405 RepID=UPI002283F66C|nr:HXXEE domain-containing protein [Streptococcus gallolyticus]MCY7150905.1 HXXEE domain-containing protein [Streptococcus gallolyticus subsp. gallolyticus]
MMTRLIKNWYFISVFMAGLFALVLGIGSWNWSQKMILVNTIFIFLHFFEEFGFPGGFPPIAMKTELKLASDDPTEWPLNHVSAWLGNWWFALSVYLLALCLPEVKFLTLTVALFSFAELAMHTLYFPLALKKVYNPGLITVLIGLAPMSVVYLLGQWQSFTIWDYLLALVWMFFQYWIAFRSPIYQKLGKYSQDYGFSKEEIARADWMMK